MGLDPARVVVIEDSHIGLQAAKAAGMNCLVRKPLALEIVAPIESFRGSRIVHASYSRETPDDSILDPFQSSLTRKFSLYIYIRRALTRTSVGHEELVHG